MDGSLVLFCYGLRVQFTTIVCFECVRSGFVLKTEAFIHRFFCGFIVKLTCARFK